jgi:hypothetical protein
MESLAYTLSGINHYLDGVYAWVLKNKEGLTREEAKRIFLRYRSPGEKTEAGVDPPQTAPTGPSAPTDRQAHQIHQILHYMEQTTQRLDVIENDIVYIKERVDAILKKL